MNRPLIMAAMSALPLVFSLTGCAPSHDVNATLKPQNPAASVNTTLPTALQNGWPQSQWWTQYHDPQLNALISQALT